MAVDTVRLRSPSIGERQAHRIEQNCKRKQQVDLATGVYDYEITTGSLAGSWDDRLSVRVEREEIVRLSKTGAVIARRCEPYLTVEGSVHKALLGHNIYGGPVEPVAAIRWLLHDLAGRLWIDLPNADGWTVQKIDWAEVYNLGTYEAAQEYMLGLNRATFPRRQVDRYGDESLHSHGSTTTVKVYRKAPEFYHHDYKRLRTQISESELAELQERASGLLRCEVSIKTRKLAADNKGEKPSVAWLTREYLESVHDREMARLLREANSTMETVRTHLEVSRRLEMFYKPELANRLFGTWFQLATLGEEIVKGKMPARTFYRQRKQLQQAGCSWQAANVKIVPQLSVIPLGFAPVRTSPRRLADQAPQVVRQVAPFLLAA